MSVQFLRQFLVVPRDSGVSPPADFRVVEVGNLRIFHCPELPLHRVNRGDRCVGVILGTPIVDKKLYVAAELIDIHGEAIEELHARMSGRFVLIDLESDRVFVDHFATLSVLFDERRHFASSVNLLPDLPAPQTAADKRSWFPLSRTHFPGIRRLIANHCLSLSTLEAKRHWPTENIELRADSTELARSAGLAVRDNIQAASDWGRINLGLTSGRDSRVLLAAMTRQAREGCDFYTWTTGNPNFGNECDRQTAGYLARRLDLKHTVLESSIPGESGIERYNSLTGATYSKFSPAYYCENFAGWDPLAVSLFGFGGEVSVAYYGRPSDEAEHPGAADLLSRMGITADADDLAEFDRWEQGLPHPLDCRQMVELLYIENRVSSWAAPHLLAVPFASVIVPFADRRYVGACLQMDYTFRKTRESQRVMIDVLADDPKIRHVPFEGLVGFSAVKRKLTVNRYWDIRAVPEKLKSLVGKA